VVELITGDNLTGRVSECSVLKKNGWKKRKVDGKKGKGTIQEKDESIGVEGQGKINSLTEEQTLESRKCGIKGRQRGSIGREGGGSPGGGLGKGVGGRLQGEG